MSRKKLERVPPEKKSSKKKNMERKPAAAYIPEEGCYGAAFVGSVRKKLTAQQRVFIAEYILDFDARRAYMAAGYTGNPTKVFRILRMPQVQEELQFQLTRRQRDRQMTADRVIEELSKVALADIRDLFDEDGNILHPKLMNESLAAALASLEFSNALPVAEKKGGTQLYPQIKSVRRWDKLKALELLGRYMGLDKVKYELSGPNGESLSPPVFNVNFIPTQEEMKMRGTLIDPVPPIRD